MVALYVRGRGSYTRFLTPRDGLSCDLLIRKNGGEHSGALRCGLYPGVVSSFLGQETASVLAPEEWQPRAVTHRDRADALTAVRRSAHHAGRQHAIEDFLFTYYPTRMAYLRRWHPGVGVGLILPTVKKDGGDVGQRPTWRWHMVESVHGAETAVVLNLQAFITDRGDTVRYIRSLLDASLSRAGMFGCFGLHEWAMVYRDREAGRDQRHPLPLRLGHTETDMVVEQHPVRCSHFDAFRFFTPEATRLNHLQPERTTQVGLEQPGCLHANMDLYKWCLKLGPVVPGDLLLDAFELARDIRWTDMAASPYDISEYDVPAIKIETPHGKAEYVRQQRKYTVRANVLRRRLLTICDTVLGHE